MVRACGAIVGARLASPAVCGAHVLQILRLFIPKHHCRLLRARHVRIVIILYIYSAGEACLAPTKTQPRKRALRIFGRIRFRPYTIEFGSVIEFKALWEQGSPLLPVHSHSSLVTRNFLPRK